MQTVAAGEFQRDLQRELAYDGLRATEAKGNKGGRRPAIPSDKADGVRAAYLGGQFMVSLVRECDVSRGAIRTVVAGLLLVHMPAGPGAPWPRSCGRPATCRAGSRAFSAPSIWSLPSVPRSTGG
ncbi:hypothetical protein ACIQAD_34490 [Streptomyces sp. NPDC088551]|uniref:hypothetical protein n=1 Tax=Streptomyces sp. NPDC088551 TaxID=3365863 RepID=UPI00381C655D